MTHHESHIAAYYYFASHRVSMYDRAYKRLARMYDFYCSRCR